MINDMQKEMLMETAELYEETMKLRLAIAKSNMRWSNCLMSCLVR